MNSRKSKYISFALLLHACCVFSAGGQGLNSVRMENGVDVCNARAERVVGGVHISMELDFRNVKVRSNRSLLVIPSLAGQSDTLMMARLSVLGRNRFIYNLRNNINPVVSPNDVAWTFRELPDSYQFDMVLPYESWMDGARIMVNECIIGCCNKTLGDNWVGTDEVYTQPVVPKYEAEFVYLRPEAEVHKVRELNAVSFVDFPVSKTEIYPKYRNNPVELKKILQTIESVGGDKDVLIRRIRLKGFASPESPYKNNFRLAKGRTESIKDYVSKYGNIPYDIIFTDFEPENWDGLAEYIDTSNLNNKQELLKIANDRELDPDSRERYLRKMFPKEYDHLKEYCYPTLRKVDYVIDYEIRVFTTVEELREAFADDPSKLSLDEFFLLARSYDEDSKEAAMVMSEAIRYYPKDPSANLNAANMAMKEGRLNHAGIMLDNAGECFEAIYARGVYNALLGNYDRALEHFTRVKDSFPEAQRAITSINNIIIISELLK